MTSAGPKYDMRHNPVYQIDFAALSSGKRVAATKRRIRFKFGFSNSEALEAGATGPECRGEEHEVNLTWSLTSGKRIIMADGQEVHYSLGKRLDTQFTASWTMNGNHTLQLIAHASPPARPVPGFRQYDLLLDGLSFFDMPKMYELGIRGNTGLPRSRQEQAPSFARPAQNNYYGESYNKKSNGYGHQEAIRYDHDPTRPQAIAPGPEPTHQAPERTAPMPSDLMSDPVPIANAQDHLSAPTALIDTAPSVVSAPTVAHDEFAPVDPALQPPSFDAVSNEILGAYGPAPTSPTYPAITNGETAIVTPPAPQQTYYAPQQQNYGTPTYDVPTAEPTLVSPPEQQPTEQLTMYQGERTSPTCVVEDQRSEVTKALESLVNLEDITVAAESPEKYKLTMKQQEQEKKKSSKKSQGLPPTAPAWQLGAQPSLADVQAHKTEIAPSKEVMKPNAFDPAAAGQGMLVVHSLQAGQGPPPIQQHFTGFGAGYTPEPRYAGQAYGQAYGQAHAGAAY